MTVTCETSHPERSSEASEEQSRNMWAIEVTCEVSLPSRHSSLRPVGKRKPVAGKRKPDKSRKVSGEQFERA